MAQNNVNYSVNGASPSIVGGTGISVKYFPNQPGPSIGVSNTTPSSSSAAGQLAVPGNNTLNGQIFTVNLCGNISIDPIIACPTVSVLIYANTGTVTSPTYTAIGGVSAVAAGNFDNEPFRVSLSLSGDTLSGVVQGTQTALFNNVLTNSTPKVITSLSGINFGSALPFGLVAGVTFSVSGANNKAFCYQFNLES